VDVEPLQAKAVMTVAPEAWETISFAPLPSLQRLSFSYDVPPSWQRREEVEPGTLEAAALAKPVPWVIWRPERVSNFRSLEPDEAAMAHVLYARRRWLVGAAGLSLVAASPGWGAPQSPTNKKSAESVPVTATEDLMREHGIVARLMLIYGAGVRRLGQGEDIDPAVFTQAGEIMRDFVHDYHEKNEEEQVFPRFKTAGRM